MCIRDRTPSGERIGFEAELQEKGFDSARSIFLASDGQVGLSSVQEQKDAENIGRILLGKTAAAIGRISQDRVRTVFGEEVSPSIRNLVLEAGSTGLEHLIKKDRDGDGNELSKAFIESGTEFYLLIENF